MLEGESLRLCVKRFMNHVRRVDDQDMARLIPIEIGSELATI